MPLPPLSHTTVNQDTLAGEFCEILGLSEKFGDLVNCGDSPLLQLPQFDPITHRLNLDPTGYGPWSVTRTTSSTFVNSDGNVESVPAGELVYVNPDGLVGSSGARIVRNLATSTATPITQNITVVVGNEYNVRIGATSAGGSTAVCSGAFTGTLTGDGIDPKGFQTEKIATTTTLTVTITGAVTDLQVEDVTAKTVKYPSEYESVGTGIGDELWQDSIISDPAITDNGDGSYAVDGSQTGYVYVRQTLAQGVNGKTYLLTCDVNLSAGNVFLYMQSTLGPTISASGSHSAVLFCGSNGIEGVRINSDFIGTISNVSIKEATIGYGIYANENGNTVDANGVVTEAVGTALTYTPAMRHAPAATNYFLNSTAPVTQTVTGIPAGSVVVWLDGTGSATLSGDATGTVTEGSPVTYTGTGAGLTCTLSGIVDRMQIEAGTVPTPFIPTSGAAATRNIDAIQYPYDPSVFDKDEGSLYMRIRIPKFAADGLTIFGSNTLFRTDPASDKGHVAYRNSSAGSVLNSHDGVAASSSSINFTSVPANTEFAIRVSWSKAANTRYIGVNDEFDATPATHAGFVATVIKLMNTAAFETVIPDCKVIDSYLTPDDHVARWP